MAAPTGGCAWLRYDPAPPAQHGGCSLVRRLYRAEWAATHTPVGTGWSWPPPLRRT